MIKIGAKVVRHGHCVAFLLAETAIPAPVGGDAAPDRRLAAEAGTDMAPDVSGTWPPMSPVRWG